jgi:hypothetical protein
MKMMTFISLFFCFSAFALDGGYKEVSDGEIKNHFAALVKDTEVENKLHATPEFATCRDKNKFDPKIAADPAKLKDATDCFTDKLKGKSDAELKKLADSLQLESYGLIKSKNVKDINEYLANKMIKALTGQDPAEKNQAKIKEQLLFRNQKFVDQSVFIELYINQLGKNALLEVSRFCFENLRLKAKSASDKTNFFDYWSSVKTNVKDLKDISIIDLTDDSKPEFGDKDAIAGIDPTKKEEVYNEMIKGVSSNVIVSDDLEDFFGFCQSSIKPLCDDFKSSQAVVNDGKSAASPPPTTPPATAAPSAPPSKTRGASACLTMSHLQSVRSAISKSKQLLESMDKLSEEDKKTAINLVLKEPIKVYEKGKGAGEQTLDELTSVASTDFLENQDQAYQQQVDDCAKDGSASGCEDNLGKKETFDKVIHNIEMESNLKREIELARIEDLRKDKQKLKDYLEENGYLELLKDDPDLKDMTKVKEAIEKNFNAKKLATIEALNSRVGKRQASENDTNQDKKVKVEDMAKESKSERARLAQVVLFNNIISSHLTLYKKNNGKNEKISRNVNVWKKEQASLDANSKYNSENFKQIQAMVKDEDTSKMKDTSLIDVGIIDIILGKDPDKN